MSRVEWTRLSGEEAETVLSIMLYRDWPRAVQVRPSQGDGGLDVVVPNEEHPDRIDVWQIKKFASNLGDPEKRQIDKSFVRLLRVIAANEHQVANWHLLMPLNPTRENQHWFAEIGARALKTLTAPPRKKQTTKVAKKVAKKAGRKAATKAVPTAQSGPKVAQASSRTAAQAGPAEGAYTTVSAPISAEELERITSWLADERFMRQWDGLIACESLAAKYPDVVDYYLHGGRARVDSAVARVASLLHGDRSLGDPKGPALQPVDLRDHLRTVQAALDGDPHYRYGVSLDPQRPPIPLEPGLLAATQEVASDGLTLTFKIFERFAEATNVRPIPIRLKIAPGEETEDARALELFQLYGKPMTVSASVSLDLPGGLGGDFEEGKASLGPTADMPEGRLRFRLINPAGTVLAVLPVAAGPTSMSPDSRGTYRQVVDASGMVEIEVLTRLDDRSTTLNASFSTQVGGLVVADALAAVEFIDAWQAGNRLQLSAEQGRFLDFFVLSDEVSHEVAPGLIKLLRAMNTIQDFATGPLIVPAELSRDEANEIVNAARLIAGETLLARWNHVVLDRRAAEVHLHQEFDVELRANWEVAIGDQVVFVGVSTTHMDAARVLQAKRPDGSESGGGSGEDDRLVPSAVNSAQISLDTTAEPLARSSVEILTATARAPGGKAPGEPASGE